MARTPMVDERPSVSATRDVSREREGHRHGSVRQVRMIADGGAIGTGPFMGAGGRLAAAGPTLVPARAAYGAFARPIPRAPGGLVRHRTSSCSRIARAREFFGEKAASAAGRVHFLQGCGGRHRGPDRCLGRLRRRARRRGAPRAVRLDVRRPPSDAAALLVRARTGHQAVVPDARLPRHVLDRPRVPGDGPRAGHRGLPGRDLHGRRVRPRRRPRTDDRSVRGARPCPRDRPRPGRWAGEEARSPGRS